MIQELTNYITGLKFDIPLYVLSFITTIVLLVYLRRMTAPFVVLVFSVVHLILLLFTGSELAFVIFSAFLFAVLMYTKHRRPELDYRKDVFSVSMLFNIHNPKQKDEKTIGRIMPYNKFQLPYNKKCINLKDRHARGLVMITGSPGSGKTFGMMSMIRQDLDNGKRTVYFDYKGDRKIIEELREIAAVRGIPVYEMSEYRTNFNYDPLASLNKTGRVEALLNTRKWSMDGSDAHYRTSTQLIIQKYIEAFDRVYDGEKPYTVAFYDFVRKQNYTRQEADAYHTLTKMLELLLTSQIKDVLFGNNEKDFSFDIEDQYLLIVSFVSSNKELANSVSSFIFKDILDTGTVKEYNKELALYVDEYGTLENSMLIKDILEKGRSCGILTTISMQDINQVVINTNQAYLNSILGIVNTFIIYSGSTRITAEMIGGVQLYDIESIMVSLNKPNPETGAPPTAMYISRYGTIERDKSIDVFKIKPHVVKDITLKEVGRAAIEPERKERPTEKIEDIPKEVEELTQDEYMKFL